jgi:hypothetical protein
MSLHTILGHAKPARDVLPHFVCELQDIRGVRVIRLQGPVGMEIGQEAQAADEMAAKSEGVFTRPLLFDFKDTTAWDFSTVAYMVQALRRRMAAHAQVGIINAPAQLVAEIEIAKVGSWFRVFASEEQALAELSAPVPGSQS